MIRAAHTKPTLLLVPTFLLSRKFWIFLGVLHWILAWLPPYRAWLNNLPEPLDTLNGIWYLVLLGGFMGSIFYRRHA